MRTVVSKCSHAHKGKPLENGPLPSLSALDAHVTAAHASLTPAMMQLQHRFEGLRLQL
jgi:hypothetical protein